MLQAKMRTFWRLGLSNVLNVFAYRIKKSAGFYHLEGGTFEPLQLVANVIERQLHDANSASIDIANEFRAGRYCAFGGDARLSGWPPRWHQNILTGEVAEAKQPWWKKPKMPRGDIKGIWELSRFDWVVDLAKAHVADPSGNHLLTLNEAVKGWQHENPPYCGSNWECGQETSLRLLSLLEAVRILNLVGQNQNGLEDFILIHLKRTDLTIRYAIAQDNNHGTSEAAALFVGGLYLEQFGTELNRSLGSAFKSTGRKWLENRVSHLIMSDGGFAQFSITYHRLMIDTLSAAEQWRIDLNEIAFSEKFYDSLHLATRWFAALVDRNTGDAPNLGSNDGAHVLRVDAEPYRDFRPSLMRAQKLFGKEPAAVQNGSVHFPDFGLAIVRSKNAKAFLRLSSCRFRPAQADPLHLDLWTANGRPIFIDSGSLSYGDAATFEKFCSISHHNTVQFDDREPMRRWSKFLYLDWLPAGHRNEVADTAMQGNYQDYADAKHFRRVEINGPQIRVTDFISGFKNKAVIRWHAHDLDWEDDDDLFKCSVATLSCQPNGKLISKRIVEKTKSMTYAQTQPQTSIEIEVHPDTTEIISLITIKNS